MSKNRFTPVVLTWLLLSALNAEPAESKSFQCIAVQPSGASNDAKLQTKSIQTAIDSCASSGGGRVYIEPGNYTIGSIELRSNVELFITGGATLHGSTNIADYRQFLIHAKNARNVAITGTGCIDGSGTAFWQKLEKTPRDREELRKRGGWVPAFDYTPKERPQQMIRFTKCKNVRMTGVRLENSPSWTVHFLRCNNVVVDRISIHNPNYGSNTDGIDLDACRKVRLTNCDIKTGDDAIVLKNTNYEGLKRSQHDVSIANCNIQTTCNAFKIGTETTADIQRVKFSDSTIENNGEFGPLAGIAIETVDGAKVSNIKIENITMSGARAPVFVRLGNRGRGQTQPSRPGRLSDVSIKNVIAKDAQLPTTISGIPGHRIQNISIENLQVTTHDSDEKFEEGAIAEAEDRYPEVVMFGRVPAYGLFARHVEGLTLHNVRIDAEPKERRKKMVLDDVKRFHLDDDHVEQQP